MDVEKGKDLDEERSLPGVRFVMVGRFAKGVMIAAPDFEKGFA